MNKYVQLNPSKA